MCVKGPLIGFLAYIFLDNIPSQSSEPLSGNSSI